MTGPEGKGSAGRRVPTRPPPRARDSYNLHWLYIMYVPVSDFLGSATSATNMAIGLCVALLALIMAPGGRLFGRMGNAKNQFLS